MDASSSRRAAGFWVVAVAFLATMAFSTLPTPLYELYRARDGFPTWTITVIFSVYAVGVIAGLVGAGTLSDSIGRRPVLLAAVGLNVVSAALFIASADLGVLIVARIVCGLGVGMLAPVGTAWMVELNPFAHSALAATVATAVNIGGLGVGPPVAALLSDTLPAPLVTPYAVVGAALVVLFGLAAVIPPETRPRTADRPPYRPQRPRPPRHGGAVFAPAAWAVFAGFAVLGLLSALVAVVLGQTMGVPSRTAAGFVVFGMFGASAAAQIASTRLPQRARAPLAAVLLVFGLALIVTGAALAMLAVFASGALLAGAGVGLLFRESVRLVSEASEADERAGALAALFLTAYLGLTVPVVGVGLAETVAPTLVVLAVFAALVAAVTVWASARLARAARGGA